MNDPRKALRLVSPSAKPPEPSLGTEPDANGGAVDPKGAGSARATGIIARPVADGTCPKCGAAIDGGTAAPLSGTTCAACGAAILVPGLLDSFRIVARIGEGAMGQIYLARDEALKRDVAIKVVHSAHAADEQHAERLREEARAAASISHPNIAQVHALGFANGHPYLVMELIRGMDMDARLRRDGMIGETEALNIAAEIVGGLGVLHRRGLTHGDIKPANIVLDDDGRAKLVDFGLSGMARRDGSGAIHGTPHYIAPELLRGAADSSQTDLYSLGATLYHLLAGRPPFSGKTPAEVVRARLEGPAEPLARSNPRLSPGTQQIVMRLLAADPAQRYPDCAAVAADLQAQVRLLEAPAAPPPQETQAATKPRGVSRRRRAGQATLLAVALIEGAVLLDLLPLPWTGRRAAPHIAAALVTPTANAASSAAPQTAAEPSPSPPIFNRPLKPVWFSVNLGAALRGSTVWRQNALIVMSDGVGIMRDCDDCRYVHTGVTGDFSFTAEVGVIATTADDALTGLLVRAGRETDAPGLFFGLQGDGRLVLYRRERKNDAELVKRAASSSFLPCRLRIVRNGQRFMAEVCGDGTTWAQFAECPLELDPTARVGLALDSRLPGRMAAAEFRNIALLVP